ncbi:MAG TPA: hypothetical protein VIO14_01995, partial [Dehalococcoidia bacterium]
MPEAVPKGLLWLFIINLGVALGAGLYEHRIVLPRWITTSEGSGRHWDAAAARQDDTGRRFWAFVTTGPLTLLTAANLAAAWRARGPARAWWLGAAGAALVDRALTLSSDGERLDARLALRAPGGTVTVALEPCGA